MPKPPLNGPAQWLYDLGVPHFHALAFGEYYETHCTGMSYSAAKHQMDYDPKGSELYHKHGRRVTAEWKDGKFINYDAPVSEIPEVKS